MPDDARRAYHKLKTLLISGPCLAFPRSNRTYALVTETSLPQGEYRGGVSATLCQIDEQQRCHVISYFSKQLIDHESRYPEALLEILAACDGMDHFDQYLRGRQFLLFMDRKPSPDWSSLNHLHKKTLARLREAMAKYNFVIQDKASTVLPTHLRTTTTEAVS